MFCINEMALKPLVITTHDALDIGYSSSTQDEIIVIFEPIDCFYSRDLQSCGTQMTNATTAMLVHITKEVH